MTVCTDSRIRRKGSGRAADSDSFSGPCAGGGAGTGGTGEAGLRAARPFASCRCARGALACRSSSCACSRAAGSGHCTGRGGAVDPGGAGGAGAGAAVRRVPAGRECCVG